MEGSILEMMLGTEGAKDLVSFIASDMVEHVDKNLGLSDESDIFDGAIEVCITENPIVQLIQMSDDDAISEFGIRLAVELEKFGRRTYDDVEVAAVRKRLAEHYANWLMSSSTGDDYEEPESEE